MVIAMIVMIVIVMMVIVMMVMIDGDSDDVNHR